MSFGRATVSKAACATREYIDIVRQVWTREKPVTNAGPHYPLPLTGEGTSGACGHTDLVLGAKFRRRSDKTRCLGEFN